MIPPARPWTLFVVDDHPVIGAGFQLATLKSLVFDWVGDAPSLPAAASRLDQLEPDVLILDLVTGDALRAGLHVRRRVTLLREVRHALRSPVADCWSTEWKVRPAPSGVNDGYPTNDSPAPTIRPDAPRSRPPDFPRKRAIGP